MSIDPTALVGNDSVEVRTIVNKGSGRTSQVQALGATDSYRDNGILVSQPPAISLNGNAGSWTEFFQQPSIWDDPKYAGWQAKFNEFAANERDQALVILKSVPYRDFPSDKVAVWQELYQEVRGPELTPVQAKEAARRGSELVEKKLQDGLKLLDQYVVDADGYVARALEHFQENFFPYAKHIGRDRRLAYYGLVNWRLSALDEKEISADSKDILSKIEREISSLVQDRMRKFLNGLDELIPGVKKVKKLESAGVKRAQLAGERLGPILDYINKLRQFVDRDRIKQSSGAEEKVSVYLSKQVRADFYSKLADALDRLTADRYPKPLKGRLERMQEEFLDMSSAKRGSSHLDYTHPEDRRPETDAEREDGFTYPPAAREESILLAESLEYSAMPAKTLRLLQKIQETLSEADELYSSSIQGEAAFVQAKEARAEQILAAPSLKQNLEELNGDLSGLDKVASIDSLRLKALSKLVRAYKSSLGKDLVDQVLAEIERLDEADVALAQVIPEEPDDRDINQAIAFEDIDDSVEFEDTEDEIIETQATLNQNFDALVETLEPVLAGAEFRKDERIEKADEVLDSFESLAAAALSPNIYFDNNETETIVSFAEHFAKRIRALHDVKVVNKLTVTAKEKSLFVETLNRSTDQVKSFLLSQLSELEPVGDDGELIEGLGARIKKAMKAVNGLKEFA